MNYPEPSALFALLCAAACAADPNVGLVESAADGGAGSGAPGSREVPFDVAPLVAETRWRVLGVEGTGPRLGDVVYVNKTSGTTGTEHIHSSGSWCIDVELAADRDNEIEFRVYGDAEVSGSKAILRSVRHRGGDAPKVLRAPPPPPVSPPVAWEPEKNQLAGAAAATEMGIWDAASARRIAAPGAARGADSADHLRALTDGKIDRAARLESHATRSNWLRFPLRERGNIARLAISSSAGCPLERYAVFLADSDDPGEPGWNDRWGESVIEVSGEGVLDRQRGAFVRGPRTGSEELLLARPVPARWLGLVIQGAGCLLPGGDGVRVHEPTEVRAFTLHERPREETPAPAPVPAPTPRADADRAELAPTCANR